MKFNHQQWAEYLLIIILLMGLGFYICWIKFVRPERQANDGVKTELQTINQKLDGLGK